MAKLVHGSRRVGVVGSTVAVLVASASVAAADPVFRFGLTSGVNRNTVEGVEAGPVLALGGAAGRFVGEVNYSYLSFLDPATGIHRAGVALRTDLTRWGTPRYYRTLYGELGFSKRWGSWRLGDEYHAQPRSQNEAHAGLGYQLDDKWQLALRVGFARRDAMEPACPSGFACRSISVMESATDLVSSVMLEWVFMLGR